MVSGDGNCFVRGGNCFVRGFNWPLHDGLETVTQKALEQQLEIVRAEAPSTVAGVFGPASITWKMDREAILFLAAGRALLLQLAHPWIAAAIAEHSTALTNPMVRFHRTFRVVFTMIFGTVDQAFATARSLHERHSRIKGVLPDTVGPFKAGSPYYANNLSALRWVHATLADSALLAHELVLGSFTMAEEALLYSESQRFAAMFGIPGGLLPADYAGLTDYVEAMCGSEILTVSIAARRIAAEIFGSRGLRLGIPRWYLHLTAGMLLERLQVDFGFHRGEAERRSAERTLQFIRRVYPFLPARLRYVGPHQEARRRVMGRPNPDLFTRLANRLWIGQSLLGC